MTDIIGMTEQINSIHGMVDEMNRMLKAEG